MSGSHFDYNCHRITQFAVDLQHEIYINDDKIKDDYSDRIGAGYSKETMDRLIHIQQRIELAGRLAREVEWLYSGDHGEDSFCMLIDEIIGDWYENILKQKAIHTQ